MRNLLSFELVFPIHNALFLSGYFQKSLYIFSLRSLIMCVLTWIFFDLLYLGFVQLFGYIDLYPLPNLWSFYLLLLQILFQPLPYCIIVYFWGSDDKNAMPFIISTRSMKCLLFIYFLSVVHIEWILLLCPQVHWSYSLSSALHSWAHPASFLNFYYCIFLVLSFPCCSFV